MAVKRRDDKKWQTILQNQRETKKIWMVNYVISRQNDRLVWLVVVRLAPTSSHPHAFLTKFPWIFHIARMHCGVFPVKSYCVLFKPIFFFAALFLIFLFFKTGFCIGLVLYIHFFGVTFLVVLVSSKEVFFSLPPAHQKSMNYGRAKIKRCFSSILRGHRCFFFSFWKCNGKNDLKIYICKIIMKKKKKQMQNTKYTAERLPLDCNINKFEF